MALKICVTADLHLGRKSSEVPASAEASSTKYTWKRIVDWALHHEVDALLLAGDVVDQANRYFEAIGPMQDEFARLQQAGILVVMVSGNHDFDVLPQLIDHEHYNNVYLLGANGSWEARSFELNGHQIQFLGWSFPNRYVMRDPLMQMDDNLADPNAVTIGLLHADVDQPESKYAPVSSSHLKGKGIDAWVLGHIHKPQYVQEADPLILYPGSPQALSPAEPGIHGPVLLTIKDRKHIYVQRNPLSPVRYEALSIDLSDADSEEAIRDMVTSAINEDAENKLHELTRTTWLYYDLILTGESPVSDAIEGWIQPLQDDYARELETGTQVAVRKCTNHVTPAVADLAKLAQEPSPAGRLAETILAIENGESTQFLTQLTERWYEELAHLNQTNTYDPLRKADRLHTKDQRTARQYILQESKHLLSHLFAQKQQ